MRSRNTTADGRNSTRRSCWTRRRAACWTLPKCPDAVKRDTSFRGIAPLASDPYAAALAAQHRLHVYRRYAANPEWAEFFAEMTATRDSYLRAARVDSLDELLRDYRFVRAGDLASLAFCNEWTNTEDDGCGYSMQWDGTTLTINPDPLDGRTIEIDITARVTRRRTLWCSR